MGDSAPFSPRPQVAFQETLIFIMMMIKMFNMIKSQDQDDDAVMETIILISIITWSGPFISKPDQLFLTFLHCVFSPGLVHKQACSPRTSDLCLLAGTPPPSFFAPACQPSFIQNHPKPSKTIKNHQKSSKTIQIHPKLLRNH